MNNLRDNSAEYNIRITLTDDWELKWWSERLGISVSQLREAATNVGNSVSKIKRYLKINL